MSFLQKGTGKDLLFLHGYLSDKNAFSLQIRYFAKYFRVTAIDFLGFGESGKLNAPFSVTDYANWTKEVLTALGVQTPHVVAHSFGCRVAVKLASLYPNTLDKMVLTGPAGIILPRGIRYKCKVGAYRLCKKLFPKMAEKRFGSKEYRQLSPLMRESYKKIVNEDLREDASKVQNPVLIIEGRRDTTTTLREAEIYEKSFPNARLRVMEGGHFAFVDNPLQFNILTEEFLYE